MGDSFFDIIVSFLRQYFSMPASRIYCFDLGKSWAWIEKFNLCILPYDIKHG